MKKKLRPLHDYVIVQRLAETQTASGIVIPDTASEKPAQGKVLAKGPGKRNEKGERIPLEVQEGNTVFFRPYASQKVDDEEVLAIREEDIFAVLEE